MIASVDRCSLLPSAAEAFSAGRHPAADFALLERVVVVVEVLVLRALQVVLADEHALLLPEPLCLASKAYATQIGKHAQFTGSRLHCLQTQAPDSVLVSDLPQ